MWLRRHRNDIIVFVIMTVGVVRGYGSRRGSDIIVRIIIGRDVAPRFYIIRCCRCHSVGCGVSGELMLCIELHLSLQASELRMKNFAGSFPQHLMSCPPRAWSRTRVAGLALQLCSILW